MYSAGRQGVDGRARPGEGRAWPPTSAGGSRSTSSTAPRSPHIFAVGDVIGFPALAARAWTRDASRPTTRSASRPRELQRAAAHRHLHDPRDLLLRADRGGADDVGGPLRGRACRATASSPAAQIVGDSYGMLKLLVSTEDRKLLGVHVFGTERHRPRAHRPGDHGLRRHRRLPRRHGASTTRRCPRPTRSPRWTPRTRCVR